ncbi:MAG: RNA-binding protein [Acidobacteria bacterium]|nr:RNA-binding protein [Acidobacteriota bacterium]
MPKKLFVGNLPRAYTDGDLEAFVTSSGIEVESARVIRDLGTGRSRGFGFVELKESEDLHKAIAALNGKEADGRALQVNEARPQAPRRDARPGKSFERSRREPRW